ncbi:MAG: hypothetical protein ACREP6_09480 [Candidatus Binataceae bacterium]
MKAKSGRFAVAALALTLAWPVGAFAQQTSIASPPGAQSGTQAPQPENGGVNWQGAGFGAAAVLGNLLYVPAKVLYAVAGGIVGGGSYLVTGGNSQVSNTIWRSSLGGDYVLTPGMIEGKQPVYFSGPNQVAPPPASRAAGPSSSAAPADANANLASGSPAYGAADGNIATSSIGSSSATGSSMGSAPYAGSNGAANSGAEPLDSGGGPVGARGVHAPPLPGTRIE